VPRLPPWWSPHLLLQLRMMGKGAANASLIQDHPRSANSVKLLEVRSAQKG
jgi:hypothetical protein